MHERYFLAGDERRAGEPVPGRGVESRPVRRPGTPRVMIGLAVCFSAAVGGAARAQQTVGPLEEVVVTASGREEPLSQVASTIQVFSSEAIRRSTAQSITDLLAEHAVGFFSEWTPAQTSINVRGGASDGQGRDFRGQVLVLLNGRRAGTANLSKLSLEDVSRIEIVRGPASVAYGTQAMGGVVNVITQSGASSEGGNLELGIGSWDLYSAHASFAEQTGDFDYYVGGGASSRDDYESGKNSIEAPVGNTAWKRRGALGSFGWQLERGSVGLTVRSDGVYDAGFRGSSWDLDNVGDRYNQSIDGSYRRALENGWIDVHSYLVRDIDDFYWGSEASGIDVDHNRRELTIFGVRSAWNRQMDSTDLLAGLDVETSELRNERSRLLLSGATATPAPFDNNQDETVVGLYVEAIQRLAEDRLTLRGGARVTNGETTILPTPGRADLLRKTASYDNVDYSLGLTYSLSPGLQFRAGYATGFRAPTGTELAADFPLVLGGQVIGNPGLDPETSQQLEVAISTQSEKLRSEWALFETRIDDRIGTEVIGTVGGSDRSQYFNNDGAIVLRGIDILLDYDHGRILGDDWEWSSFFSGSYHFDMRDEGAAPTDVTDRPERIYEYQAGVGTRIGRPDGWSLQLSGVLRGPMWWDTEERLLIPEAEPQRAYIRRKSAFWVWNLKGSFYPKPGWRLSASIENLFDENNHPIFFALNKAPLISDLSFSNGGVGNSMPGRNLMVRLQIDF